MEDKELDLLIKQYFTKSFKEHILNLDKELFVKNLSITHQLKLVNGWYVQQKENMSPWKVFSLSQIDEHDCLWLLFRYHKLCGAKYNWFINNEYNYFMPVIEGYDSYDSYYLNSGSLAQSIGFISLSQYNKNDKKANIENMMTFTKMSSIQHVHVFINYVQIKS